ncbi:MAG: sodium:alanine symporter family protein, partial [Chlamydiae bacterium]|nr:sodium:alanine symporter family protein [Chlamydiota bacterium]
QALFNGSLVGGGVSALRWGILKGVQVTEAGVGTQTIPHSLAETSNPQRQGALAMISTFSAGGIAFLSGCVALLTGTWQDETLPLGMAMVFASYQNYFSMVGLAVVAISAFLFGFGTILGNSFNGTQCFGYVTKSTKKRYFIVSMMVMVFLGGIGEARVVWSMVDILMVGIVVPHVIALFIGVRRWPELFVHKTATIAAKT